MKVKVKEGVGKVINSKRSFREGIVYYIPDSKFDPNVFVKIEEDKPKSKPIQKPEPKPTKKITKKVKGKKSKKKYNKGR